ncbi:GAG-binding domain-containing protein [Streptococcus cuniculi]|uniref:Uncharacterized protein n=1 Tax=Streptococcus cuniculi TaxID=1432788 RepID=A0A4Y9J8Z2_9STRE|nr:GAG-binding domain-containing protein [Streptococcus cuniculi]MBF0778556.1 hypothetical protein [Streptococcus cuniculi]TFU97490.1 hypothetical protein E4T82_07450 [Streptococcus cuniculi]
MKKQLYLAATAALVAVAPHAIQAEQPTPNEGNQEAPLTATTASPLPMVAHDFISQKRVSSRAELDSLAYLTAEQKEEFKKQIEVAQSEIEVDNALFAAKKANIQALKDEESETVEKAIMIFRDIRQLPELTDASLYDGQMYTWSAIGDMLDGYLQSFYSLNPEIDANLTNQELARRLSNLYNAFHYGTMEYIARDLEQKHKQFPDNQEL